MANRTQKQPKAIFFDAGNTLFYFDSKLFQRELANIGIPLDPKVFDAAHPKASRNLGRLIAKIPDYWERYRVSHFYWFKEGGLDEKHFETALNLLRTHPQRHLFWSRFPAAIRAVVERFKKMGFKTGIISNTEGQMQRQVDHLKANALFDTVVDSQVVGVAKPDPAIFNIALERVGAQPSASWHVGDMFETDVVGARAAGLMPILFDPDGLYPEADVTRITRLETLLEMLS